MYQPGSLKDKIQTLPSLEKRVSDLKEAGKKVVFTNGCFDILHAGHVNLLEEARMQGDALVVAMNSDSSVRGLKGPTRPVVPQQQRSEVLAALESVDFVTAFDEPDPLRVITALKPDVLVKGGDWGLDSIIGRDVVEEAGGTVLTIPLKYGASTTDIISKIIQKYLSEQQNG